MVSWIVDYILQHLRAQDVTFEDEDLIEEDLFEEEELSQLIRCMHTHKKREGRFIMQ